MYKRQGTDYACAVRGFGPDTVELEILSSSASVSEPGVRVTLYVGYPKQDKPVSYTHLHKKRPYKIHRTPPPFSASSGNS